MAARPNRFVTLTCRHQNGQEAALERITKSLPRLITALRKSRGEIDYFRMWESCEDGYPHFHLLVRSEFIPHSEIKALWERLTEAPIVDIRKAHGRSMRYVAKYLNKARNRDKTWSRQRISVSKKFWVPETTQSELMGWQHDRTHPIDHCESCPATSFDQEWFGRYVPRPRQPGDELPHELQHHELGEHNHTLDEDVG